ncbi:MAG: SRPBCC domain-containing protein [Balneolaceae bacterium]|nr:SRPBCC domain-containing protein [Balneolaceae bacterium]MBO6546811.1 SRPBCC domain-containing protein [Balneolaceae bacterium]MBO6649171.1 SRPBCC domain-containing protein [Balneolaceae bacterium]
MSQSNEHALEVSKIIDADKASIFKALTDNNIMEKWFFAGPDGWSATVEADVKTGGSYKIDMHSQEETYSHHGEYKEVIDNEKIVFTWNSQAVSDTVVTITLTDVEGGIEVKLVHDFMPNEEMKTNHTNGWTAILDRLAANI